MNEVFEGLVLLARADNRGLGLQTQRLYRMLRPERTIVIDVGNSTPYEQHFDWYPDGIVLKTPLRPIELQKYIKGMDCVLSAETFYFDDFPIFAQTLGTRTVLQFNYEFCRWATISSLPRPSKFIAPSEWKVRSLPFTAQVIPPPVMLEDFECLPRTEAKNFVHVVGHPAFMDRAGTRLVMESLRYVKNPIRLFVRCQQQIPWSEDPPKHIEVIYEELSDLPNSADLYSGADVLLAPRRYGGLSLPIQEASALGMPIIALNRAPESSILPVESRIPARISGTFQSIGGPVEVFSADPRKLASRIDYLYEHPDLVKRLSEASRSYATTVSSEVLYPEWQKILRKTGP